MNWELLLHVTLPIFAMMAWGWKQLNHKMDRIEDKLYGRIDSVEDKLSGRLDIIENKLDDVRDRAGRLEGAFYERGYWESRKTGGDK